MATYQATAEQKLRYGALFLLGVMIGNHRKYSVLLDGMQAHLEPLLEHLFKNDLVELEGTSYVPSALGRARIKEIKEQDQANDEWLQLFKHVDFGTVDGEVIDFAYRAYFRLFNDAWKAHIAEERWSDVRTAVAIRRGLDPMDVVMADYIHREVLDQSSADWEVKLITGELVDEIAETVGSQLHVEDIGDDGPEIITKIIRQGEALWTQLLDEEQRRQEA